MDEDNNRPQIYYVILPLKSAKKHDPRHKKRSLPKFAESLYSPRSRDSRLRSVLIARLKSDCFVGATCETLCFQQNRNDLFNTRENLVVAIRASRQFLAECFPRGRPFPSTEWQRAL